MTTESDSYFGDLCENLGFVLIAVDRDLSIHVWNSQAVQQFGYSAEEIAGRCILEIIPEDQHEEAKRLFDEVIKAKAAGEMEIKYDREDGKRTTFVLIVSPIIDSTGGCVGASASMRDISARKRLSRELAQSRRMAALGNMAGAVAHHFNNILGGMLTSIDYVLPSDSPRELRRTLRLLAQAIGRATRITKQLEAFAECEHEVATWMELSALMESFIERIRPLAEQAKIHLVTDIVDVSSRPFEAQRLMPALESLARNALDAMTPEGTLSVRMWQEGDEAVVTIADTGCGISEDVLDRVFEPFFTTKGELAGGSSDNIGLGLAAVHGLVAELGGDIHVESKVGKGTRAVLRLPLNRDGQAEGPSGAAPPSGEADSKMA